MKKIFIICATMYLICVVVVAIMLKLQKPPQDIELVSNIPISTITIIDTGETIYQRTAPIEIVEWDRKNKYLEFIDHNDGIAQRVQWNEYCVVLVTTGVDAYIGGGR